MSLTKVTYSMIDGPVANVVDFGADPTGVADSYAAIKAAYDSDAAIIQLPPGTFKMSQTLVLGRGVIFNGSGAQDGSGGNGQSAGDSSTVINFTGTGNAIEVGASYTEQVSNVHVSNLMITGNSGADGGLFVGTLTGANKCTFKNLGIFNFTNSGTNKGYGLGIRNNLESLYENVYVAGCQDGINIGFGACTSLQFNSCFSRNNLKTGWLIREGNGFSLYQCLAEGNVGSGFVINPLTGQTVSQVALYSYYSEYNATDAVSPAILIRTTGSGSCYDVTFYSLASYDYNTYNAGLAVWDYPVVDVGATSSNVSRIKFYNATIYSASSGFANISPFSSQCVWNGYNQYAPPTNIIGNTFDSSTGRWTFNIEGAQIYSANGTYTPTVVSGGTQSGTGYGTYQQVGKMCTVIGTLAVTAATTDMKVSLPISPSVGSVPNQIGVGSTLPGVTSRLVVESDGLHFVFSGTYSGGAVSVDYSVTYTV